MQAVPAEVDVDEVAFGQAGDPKLVDQAVQRGAVKVVEFGPGLLALADAVHRWLVGGAPGIDQRGPVRADAFPGSVCGKVGDQAGPPIDYCAECVEYNRNRLLAGHYVEPPYWPGQE